MIVNTAKKTLDQFARSSQAKAFSSLSPTSLGLAYLDWVSFLASSPGKQAELAQLAVSDLKELNSYLIASAKAPDSEKLDPPKSDRRFNDEAWQQWPYNIMHQGYLLTQAWWDKATSDIDGVSPKHLDQVSFWAKQWLEMVSPTNSLLTNPIAIKRTQEELGMNLVRGFNNFIDDIQRQQSGQAPAGTENFKVGINIAATPGKVVMKNQLAELIQYDPTTETVHPEPIFLVPAWIMKYYILDLSEHNSMVAYLRDQGFTVFCLSWKNPGKEEANLSMDDYLKYGFFDSLDLINKIVPKQKIHAVGYCLGGTLLSIAAAAMARNKDNRLASATLLAAQVDFSEPGDISLFIDHAQVDMLEAQMKQLGYLEQEQMSGAFQMLRSYDLIWARMFNEYILGDRASLNDLMAWNADTTRMPARMHSEYLRQLYLNNDLSANRYKVNGKIVSLSDIRVPMFSVGTVTDHVAPWHSVYKLHQFVNTEVTFALTSAGHNAGIISAPDNPRRTHRIHTHKSSDFYMSPQDWLDQTTVAQGSWWPAWVKWLQKRSGAKVATSSVNKVKSLGNAPGTYILEA